MVRKVLYPAVFVLIVLAVGSAYAAFDFQSVYTFTTAVDMVDGQIRDSAGNIVQDGALVQYIVGIEGAAIVDPLDYFGNLETANGVADTLGEQAAAVAWLNGGADPAAISGGMNVLAADLVTTPFTGEFETINGIVSLNGIQHWDWRVDPAYTAMPRVQVGLGVDPIAIRAWNLTKQELLDFCTEIPKEAWYMTTRERGMSDGPNAPADMAMVVGLGWVPPGGDPTAFGWVFDSYVGVEVAMGLRTQNRTDTFLVPCPIIPEPGTMLLIGGSALLLLIRRKK
jgi:hypothetical protein